MTHDPGDAQARPEPPPLKLIDPEVNDADPWSDDRLDREQTAHRLTKIIEDQGEPFVITLDGRWGTGKTFLLKRWQAQMTNDGFSAIYFNAWEDDFCDDPLLAITGQLSAHFKDDKYKDVILTILNSAVALITNQLLGAAVDVKALRPDTVIGHYQDQRRVTQQLAADLEELAKQVRKGSGKPLVFIIDELDRCRPTFAIELLERVKHILSVPNVVFVFGINRSEMVNSLRSIYGEIDACTYLRRFFDMEFTLPEADPVAFCTHLIEEYGISSLFSELSDTSQHPLHATEYRTLSQALPRALGYMGLSLRDIDYSLRLVSLACRGLQQRQASFPEVLVLLVAVKVSNPDLYRRFIQGNSRGAELVDYMNERSKSAATGGRILKADDRWQLDFLESALYSADDGAIATKQLELLRQGDIPDQPEYLAKESRGLDPESEHDANRLDNMLRQLQQLQSGPVSYGISAQHLATQIDVYAELLNR